MNLADYVNPIIPWLRERERARNELYDHVISPVFEGTKQATIQYNELFSTAQKMLLGDEDVAEIVAILKGKRSSYLVERAAVSSLVEEAEKMLKDKRILSFLRNIYKHLFPYNISKKPTSRGLDFIRFIDMLSEDSHYKEYCFPLIQQRADRLQEKWTEIAAEYAKLTLEYTLPIGLYKK